MCKGQSSCSRRIFHSAVERPQSPDLQELVSGTTTIIYFPRGHIYSDGLTMLSLFVTFATEIAVLKTH